MDEAKLSRWIIKMTCGSYLVFGLIVMMVYAVMSFDTPIGLTPFVIKSLTVSVFYIISILLIATLPNKPITRRLWSWFYSVIFHFSLLIYMYIATDSGSFIFILLLAETLIAIFVAIGLYKALRIRYGVNST